MEHRSEEKSWLSLAVPGFVWQTLWYAAVTVFCYIIYRYFNVSTAQISQTVCIGAIAVTFVVWLIGIIFDRSMSFRERMVYCLRPSVIKENGLLYSIVGSFTVFGISIQIFIPYLIAYYEKTLNLGRSTGMVLLVSTAAALAAASVYGRIYEMAGFKTSVLASTYILIAGLAFLFFSRTLPFILLGSILMMIGCFTGTAVFAAMTKEHVPEDKAGLFRSSCIFARILSPGVIGSIVSYLILRGSKTEVSGSGTVTFIPGRIIFLASIIAAVVLIATLYAVFELLEKSHFELWTAEGEELYSKIKDDPDTPVWDVYPRPQLVRGSYYDLNGKWKCNDSDITVPFAPQSMLSGYDKMVFIHFLYKKRFRLPESFLYGAKPDARVILHFGAVDQIADVSLNGVMLGHHECGYLDFSFDCTDALKKNSENELIVKVKDTLSHDYPYGKQRHDRGGMWYTPVSGIWKSVWMECVPRGYVRDVRITPDMDGITLSADTDELEYKVEIYEASIENTDHNECNGAHIPLSGSPIITRMCSTHRPVRIDIGAEGSGSVLRRLWTPDEPYLYRMRITAGDDSVISYFALRTIGIEEKGGMKRVCLNGQPVYFNGALDQGYYSDGIYTPASPVCYKNDILKMKELGFNMLRKHIKIEPEEFYYDCDRYGMLVMQDMVNNGFYRHFHDTLSPNVWLFDQKIHPDTLGPATETQKKIFRFHMCETVRKLYDHPCIIAYTIFNEGWGQFDSDEMYDSLKRLDPTRLIDSTSGWFKQKKNDFDSRHIYFHIIDDLKCDGRPLFISECGGFACSSSGHTFSRYMNFGYGIVRTREALFDQIRDMYEKMMIPAISRGLCGSVYTQVSDVEDEINGLLTYDRRVDKSIPEKMRTIKSELDDALKASVIDSDSK